MAEYLKNNPIALRHCILYEFLRKKSVQESFNAFCETVGDDVIEKEEFQSWFNKFEQGNFELNLERNEEKKVYQLTDMPIDVMENIVKHLDVYDRRALTRTCRSVHQFVKDQKVFLDSLMLSINKYKSTHFYISIGFGSSIVKYRKSDKDCLKEFNGNKTLIQGVPFWKQALLDFKNIIKNPKLHMDVLRVNFGIDYRNMGDEEIGLEILNELETVLKSAHKLNVKELEYHSSFIEPFLKILPYLKPGYLTTIAIELFLSSDSVKEELKEMEQWKQATNLFSCCLNFVDPFRNLSHFKKFDVYCDRISMSVEDVRQIKEVLLKSPDFEKCKFSFGNRTDTSDIKREFGAPFIDNICHYPIPNTTEFFEIDVGQWRISVSRKKK